MTRRAVGPASARHRAREVAFRVLYQAEMAGDGWGATWEAMPGRERLRDDQRELVGDVVAAMERDADTIDAVIREAAPHWPLERMSATDRSVLRAAVAEMLSRAGTPARVVLDEAIEIAKKYGSEESGRFVNGVLDRVARALRPEEF